MSKKPVIPVANPNNGKQKWEELTDIHETIVGGIYDITSQLQSLLNSVKDYEGANDIILIKATETITNDIKEFSNALMELKERYEGKKGYVKDGNELALCLDVFNDYVLLNDRFKAITLEPLLTITQQVNKIVSKNKKATEQ